MHVNVLTACYGISAETQKRPACAHPCRACGNVLASLECMLWESTPEAQPDQYVCVHQTMWECVELTLVNDIIV